MKIVYNDNKDTYSIKGLSNLHLQILDKLCSEVILGDSVYETAAFDLCDLFEEYAGQYAGHGLYDHDFELKVGKKGITFVTNDE